MLTDIFSSFDPATSSLFNNSSILFWMFNFFILATLQSMFWLAPSRMSSLISLPIDMMHSQATRTFTLYLKGMTSILVPLFFSLIIVNLSGLIPYMFSTSSHLLFTLILALPLWLSLMLSAIFKAPSSFIAALLPSGAPSWLNPFLTLIESTSILVRPITLSFRLAANMSAGHIILGLIGIYTASAFFNSLLTSLSLLSILTIYVIFEVGICLIQAYIFCLLITLYADDHPSH
nr:ATPase F0 subunit 6 [Travisia sanrikuensis]